MVRRGPDHGVEIVLRQRRPVAAKLLHRRAGRSLAPEMRV
jgi:hypothetical protein